MQSSYSTIYFSWLVTVLLIKDLIFGHIVFNSPKSKAQVRYDNHHSIFMVSCHCLLTFSKKYYSRDVIIVHVKHIR